jgi:hypothetical protein
MGVMTLSLQGEVAVAAESFDITALFEKQRRPGITPALFAGRVLLGT